MPATSAPARRRVLSRRTWLRAVGGAGTAAIALPALRMMEPPHARADVTIPKRFLAMYTPQGHYPDEWGRVGTGSAFTLGSQTAALAPHRDDVTLIRGMQCLTNYHTGNCTGFLNGSERVDGGFGGSISVDQRIAQVVAVGELRSLEVGVNPPRGGEVDGRSAFVTPARNTTALAEGDPARVFNRLFGGAATEGAGMEEMALRQSRRMSILDVVTGELASIRSLAGPEDRRRLDEHATAIREIELRIASPSAGPTRTCTDEPGVPSGLDPFENENLELVGRLQMDLVARAFICDRVRVATFLWFKEKMNLGMRFPWLEPRHPGIGRLDPHNDIHHEAGTAARVVGQWYFEQLAYLLSALGAAEVDGSRVLDHSVVYFGSGLPYGSHGGDHDYGFVVAGSGGGFFRTGQFLDFRVPGRRYGEGDAPRVPGDGMVFHNRLLLSFLRCFGIDDATFGSAPHSAGGPLDGGLLA